MGEVTRRVLKWSVPVDDQWHPIGSGPVLHVASSGGGYRVVQVWTDEADADRALISSARVYGTGQPVPEYAEALGSTLVDPLVWHVFRSTVSVARLAPVDEASS